MESDLPWVYGAAVKAAATHEAAARATAAGIREALGLTREPSRQLQMACAVRAALAEAPCLALATLPPPQREALGLARIVGMNVNEIAELLEAHPREVKRWMLRGLSRDSAQRTPPPPLGSGSGASRGRDARAS